MRGPLRSMAHGSLQTPEIEVLIAVHTRQPPSQAEWAAWCDLLRQRSEAVQWDLTRTCNLVLTDGGAPSTEQRTMVNSLVAQGRSSPRVAVVTDSAAVRMIARAFTIFNPMFKVFSPQQLAAATSFLGVARPRQRDLLATLDRLEAEQLGRGAVETLKVLRRSAR